MSVSGDVGIVNQIEFQGRSFAGILVNNYGVVKTGYVVYTKSPLKNNPYGIIKANKGMDGIVSTLYAIYKPKVNVNSNFVQIYFEQNARMNNYMQPLVNKGAKNDMKISSENALKGNVIFPIRKEQDIIVDFFFKIDHLITLHQSKSFGHILEVIVSCTLSWEQRKLGEIAERIVRKNEKLESTLPLTISAQYGLIDQNEFFDKRIASKDVRGYYLIKKGEFAYNKSTSVDAPLGAIKRLDKYNNGVLSTLYILFKIIDNTSTSSDYLVTYYSTDLWHKGIQSIAAEGARNHGLLNIAPNDFFETMLSIPLNVSEQKKVGGFFISLDHLITLHQLEPFQMIFKAIAYRIIDYAKSKPPRCRKHTGLISFIKNTIYKNCVYTQYIYVYSLKTYYIKDIILLRKSAYICNIII